MVWVPDWFSVSLTQFFGFLRYLQAKSSISFSLPLLSFQFISYLTFYDTPSVLLTLMHQITHKTRFIIHSVTVWTLFQNVTWKLGASWSKVALQRNVDNRIRIIHLFCLEQVFCIMKTITNILLVFQSCFNSSVTLARESGTLLGS